MPAPQPAAAWRWTILATVAAARARTLGPFARRRSALTRVSPSRAKTWEPHSEQKVTEAHGGRVDVRSTLGRGCLFEVDLPVALPSLAPPERTAARERSGEPDDGGQDAGKEAVDRPPQGP